MISPIILKCLNSNLQITQENEILDLNEKSQIYGLTLNKEDVKEIINSRDNTLKSYGRIELDIGITKMIIENLYKSVSNKLVIIGCNFIPYFLHFFNKSDNIFNRISILP